MNIDKQILAIIKEKFGNTNFEFYGQHVCKNTLKNHISHEKKEKILKYLQCIVTPSLYSARQIYNVCDPKEFGAAVEYNPNQKKETEVKMNYKEALIEELKKRSVSVAEFLKEKDNLSKHAYRYINGIDDKITTVLKYIDKISTKELLGIILAVKDLDNSKCAALRYEIRFGKIIQQYVGNKLSDYEGVVGCIDEVFMCDVSQYIKRNVPYENICDYLEEYFSNTWYKTIYETLMKD